MLFLPCPYCGPRDHSEFRYGGDAGKTRPAHGVADAKAWHDHVFLFDNPKGAHKEYWQHVLGCRRWVVVERDTLTQHIAGSRPARDEVSNP
jgi:methylglutamate dehydrogenase subunit B